MPPPLWLKQYEEIYPGFTNRCFDQQEQESVNRRKIEGDYSSGFKWAALMSIAGAIIAILTLIAFAFYALSLGQVILAGSTITVGVVAFAAVLLYRRTRPHQKTKAGKDQD